MESGIATREQVARAVRCGRSCHPGRRSADARRRPGAKLRELLGEETDDERRGRADDPVPDARGRFGRFGGRYVPEVLIPALDELAAAWSELRDDPGFRGELDALLRDYVGRPTPLTFARRLSEELGYRIWLKREDLAHTGAHKINNTLGPGAAREAARARGGSSPRPEPASTVSPPPTACALFGLPCVVYMGEEDTSARRRTSRGCSCSAPRSSRCIGRQPHAEGRDQRGDARLGGQRARHALRHRLGRGAASLPGVGARPAAGDRRRGARADPRSDGRRPRCRRRVRGRGEQRDRHVHRVRRRDRHAADRRRGRRARRSQLGEHCRRSRRASPGSCTVRSATCSRTRTVRSSTRIRSRPASTTRASVPSTRT